MNIHYETKTELIEKMEALKVDINEADEKYQQALARGDFDTCGKYSNERAQYRRTFAKCLKFKILYQLTTFNFDIKRKFKHKNY